MEQDRQEEIAESLEGLLVDGERFVVDCHDGRVDLQSIEEANLKPLAEEKPELYGHLLAVSEALSDAGSSFVLFAMITVAGICLAIHMDWIDTFLNVDVQKIQSPWVYAFVLIACFFASGQIALWIEASAYRRHRGEVIRAVRDAGLTRWHLLARISQDEDLSNLVEKLKTDSRPWGDSRFDP